MTAPAERDALLERLAGLPAGFTLRRIPARADEAPPALETDGRGELELHALLPGVTLAYWAVLGGTVRLAGARRPALIAACCRRGSLRCAPDGGLPALDVGTIAICGQPDCPRTLTLPDGVCEGLALRFDCPSLARSRRRCWTARMSPPPRWRRGFAADRRPCSPREARRCRR